ncbi:unnamed protein product [Didymodactylos carnosus]|uniref:Uncharacterized protein n=1 Tax=Didymodactylos carnosus TaxID=1234261 RepID=A0A8S2D1Z8_9BILA|nr:unnamed protein product [Didymodactylos carnosus]CAF3642969.1 unnamed protein product [Didymodactylos carnosus]
MKENMQRRRGIGNIRGARQSVRNMPLAVSQCFGCAQSIYDPLISNVLDRFWHPDCVKCYSCRTILSDKCYSRDGKLFCKDDFYRHFGHYCASCHTIIQSDDYIRRSKGSVYHANCFSCTKCKRLIHDNEDIFIDKIEQTTERQQQHDVYLCHDCHATLTPKILPPPPPSSVDEEETSDSQMSNSTTSKTPIEQQPQQQSSSSSDIVSKSDERDVPSQPVAISLQQLSLTITNSPPRPLSLTTSVSLISPKQSQKSPVLLTNSKTTAAENEEQAINVLSSPKSKNKSPTSNHQISPIRNNKSPIKAHSSSSSSSNETPKTITRNHKQQNNSSTKASLSKSVKSSRTKQNPLSNNTTENNKKKPLTLSSPATRSKAAALAAASTTKVGSRKNKKQRPITRKRHRPLSDSETEEEEEYDEQEDEYDMEEDNQLNHHETNGKMNDKQQQKQSESNDIDKNITTTNTYANTNDDSNNSSRSSSFKLPNEKKSDDEEEKELKIATPETSIPPTETSTTTTVTTSGSVVVSDAITSLTTTFNASPMSISSIMKQPLPQQIDSTVMPSYLTNHFPSPQPSMFVGHPMSHYPNLPAQHPPYGPSFPHMMQQRPPQMLPQQPPATSVLQHQLSSSPISQQSHSTNASETDSLDRSLSPSQMDISTNAEASSTPIRQMGSPKFNRQHNNNKSVAPTPTSNPRPSALTSLLEYGHYPAATSDNLSSQMRQSPFPFPFQMQGAAAPYQTPPPVPFYRPSMAGPAPDVSGQIFPSQPPPPPPPPAPTSPNKKSTKKQMPQQQQPQMLSNADVSQNIVTSQPKKKGRKLGSKNKISKAEKTKAKLAENDEKNLPENKNKAREHHSSPQTNELQKRHFNEVEDDDNDEEDLPPSSTGMLPTPVSQYSQLPEHLSLQTSQQSANHQNLLTKMGLLNHQSMPPPPPPSNGNNLMMNPLMTPNGMMMAPHHYLPSAYQAAFNPAFAAAAYASGYNPYPPFHPAFGHPGQPPPSQHMNFLPQNNGMSTPPTTAGTNLTEKPVNDHHQTKVPKSKGAKHQQSKQQQLPPLQSNTNNMNPNYIPSSENIKINKNSNPTTTTDSSEEDGDDDMDGKICNGKKLRQASGTGAVGIGTDSDGSGTEMDMNLSQSSAGNSFANDNNAKKGGRTTIKAPQLEILCRSFEVCPKPTKQQREQLAAETGLNMRVIQVWFQNKRSKERKNNPKNADDSPSSPPQLTTNTDRSSSNF